MPMLENAARPFGGDDFEPRIALWGRAHPLGRVGTIAEVANLGLSLASDEASFGTGVCYRVDGGLLSPLPVRPRRRTILVAGESGNDHIDLLYPPVSRASTGALVVSSITATGPDGTIL
jgi:hypothetical protein